MMKWLWLSAAVVALDQATKYLASVQLDYNVPVAVLPFFNLTLLHNTGAAFSFLSDAAGWQRWFFIILAAVVSLVLIVWLRRLQPAQRWLAVALALVIGGAVGNVIDRLLYGYVIDFIQLYYQRWYWPAFNAADSAISVGAVILVLDGFLGTRRHASVTGK